MIKHYLVVFTLIFLICLIGNFANACKCYPISFEEDSDKADMVFRGIAINKKDSISIGKVFYTFKVTQVWKGQYYQNIIIETNYGGQACGETFILDSEYVVYSNKLETSRCGRNSLASVCSDIARLNYKYIKGYKQNFAFDPSDVLSKIEGDYFNIIFINHFDKKEQINFINKKVAIFDPRLITKREFFEKYGMMSAPIGFEKFSEKEVEESGGYSGIISLYRKMRFTKRAKRKIIKQLSKRSEASL
ncbi:MAG: hypothetical protein H0W75_07460 [Chitinophagaceae bacterium]|nr:hypothetical protein [Chitinophagaceae bacterium]